MENVRSIEPVINNVKGRLKVVGKALEQLNVSLLTKNFKRHGNYVSLKETYSYNIFSTGTINVTGIKSMQEIENVADNVCKDFNIEPSLIDGIFVIDSTTATGDFKRRVNLTAVQQYVINNKCAFTTAFNREVFCAVYCKSNLGPTIVLFASGKFNILGGRCIQQILATYHQMSAIIHQLTMNRTVNVYARAVEKC